MKIAIDVSPIIYGTGVSHYRENLVKNLLKIDSKNSYIIFGGSFRRYFELKEKISELGTRFQSKTLLLPPTLAHLLWNKYHVFNIESLIGDFDVVHTSDWAEPPSKSYKVTTVHDLIPTKYPDITPDIIVKTHRERQKRIKVESKIIIVPSKSTMKDLIEEGFDAKKIRVIFEAPNMIKVGSEEIAATKSKYLIKGDYVISIGTHPRKNLARSIEAFKLLKKRNLALIVVGERNYTDLQPEKNIKFVGHVTDRDLNALVTGAKIMLFPSLYEGLGIPILDGFACQIPVVTSNVSAMAEVSGDASVLVNPLSIQSISEGIEEALSNREKYIARGTEQVKTFSWEKTARETLDVYKTAVS